MKRWKIVGPVLRSERLRQVFPRFVRQNVGCHQGVKDLPNEPDDFCAGARNGRFYE